MNRFGTNYGGWNLPTAIDLSAESIIYSGGVGEDISFDILVQEKYKSNIILIDPTRRALKHYEEVQNYYKTGKIEFTGDIQPDYIRVIGKSKPDFSKFTFVEKGLWSEKTDLKFYKPTNEKYVSHTLIENMYSNNYDMVHVDSIKNIMENLGHTHIDILKIDIEGSEIVVLNKMLDDQIYPKYLCIEFDLKLKNVDHKNETSTVINRLLNNGYILAENNNFNCLFVRSKA